MATYNVGSWHGIAAGNAIALLPPNVPLPAIEQIWLDLHDNKGLAALLDGLGEVFGTSLKALPEFAIVSELPDRGSLSVAVRGPIEAKVSSADGSDPLVVTGASVTTWSEQVLSGVAAVELSAPGAAGQDLRPVRDGVVPADRIAMAVGKAVTVGTAIPDRSQGETREPAATPELQARAAAAPPTLESVPEAPIDVPGAPDEGWLSAASGAVKEQESTSQSDPEATTGPEAIAASQDAMLSETMLASSVEDAARRTDPDASSQGSSSGIDSIGSGQPPAPVGQPDSNRPAGRSDLGGVDGDHDNLTLAAEQIRELQAAGLHRAPSPSRDGRAAVQLVIPGAANVTLDRAAIIGRRPRLTRVAGGHVPQLVTVPSPGGGVSGNHIELRIEGISVLAVDLDSTNGTRLLRPGRQPVRLPPGEETLLVPGDQLDLGEGVLLSFEGLA